jgi:hypothetical protein
MMAHVAVLVLLLVLVGSEKGSIFQKETPQRINSKSAVQPAKAWVVIS